MALPSGTPSSSSGAQHRTPAGFEWAPLSTIAIDAVDSNGSAVALDAILPLPPGSSTRTPAATHEPRSNPHRPWRIGWRWVLLSGVAMAMAAAAATFDVQAIARSSQTVASAVDRQLAALFTPIAVRIVPGATVDFGTLSVNAVPWAEVAVDGRWIGRTPLASLSLSAGSHRLIFRHPDFGELETVAVVTANETAYATVHFTPTN